jgi:predicted Fe-S protein YdhL (DUF1289 family)
MIEHNRPQSPCISLCTLDPMTSVCTGCYRTIEEIAGWMDYSDEQKGAILDALPARRATYEIAETTRPADPINITRLGVKG